MQFLPSLAVVLDEASALFLQQLQYWVYHSRLVIDGKYWVYNTLDQWNLQFYFWSKSKLQRTIKHLQSYEIEGECYHLVLIEIITGIVPIRRSTTRLTTMSLIGSCRSLSSLPRSTNRKSSKIRQVYRIFCDTIRMRFTDCIRIFMYPLKIQLYHIQR